MEEPKKLLSVYVYSSNNIAVDIRISQKQDLVVLLKVMEKITEIVAEKMMGEVATHINPEFREVIKSLETKTPAELEQLFRDLQGLLRGQ